MAEFKTELGVPYRNGTDEGWSHLVGWDQRKVRSKVYKFTVDNNSYSHVRFWGPPQAPYDGAAIPIRYGISSNLYDFVTEYGEPLGTKEYYADAFNDIDINLSAGDYYLVFFPGTTIDSGNWYGLRWFGYVPEVDSQWSSGDDWITIFATQTTPSYTNCTPPTRVSISPSSGIVVPGGSATLSWSGATAGDNMNISKYRIYRSTSPNSSYTQIGETTDGTTTSYSVTAPDTRGTFYYYRIMTIGSIEGYDSSLSNAKANLKANTLPNAPTVSASPATLPSTGDDVTFTITDISDRDGQNLSLYYATSSSGTKTACNSPLTIYLSGAATYYFYVYDGLEYSEPTSQSIILNVRPEISSITCSVTDYMALGGDGDSNYQICYANGITPTITTNKTGTVYVRIEHYESNDTTVWPSPPPQDYQYTDIEVPITSTSTSLGNFNIHQYITLGSTNIHWRLRFYLKDSANETSDFIYYPSDNYYYCIARPSSLLASYNQFANSNISGTITGQMWNKVRLKVYNDTSVTNNYSASAVVNFIQGGSETSTTINASSIETSVDGTGDIYRYLDITFPDTFETKHSEATVYITATMKDVNNFSKSVSASMTETKIPLVNSLNYGWSNSIKPFTDTGTFEVNTVWPFGLYDYLDETTLGAYNCSTSASNAIKLVYSSTGTGSGSNRVEKTSTWTRSGDNLTTTMNVANVYEWNQSLGITTYAGLKTYYCRLEIINLFGKVTATPWITRSFDFRETVQSPTITSIDWSTDKTNWASLGNKAIQEGAYLRFNCSFSLYSTDEITVSMLLKNSSGERSVECYEYGSPSLITPITYSDRELRRASDRTPYPHTKSYVFYVNTEIVDTTDREWRIQFVSSGGTSYSSYISTPVVRHCAPNLVLMDCDTDEDYELTYVYNMSDLGYDSTNENNTIVNYLSDGETRMASTSISNTVGQGVEGTLQATETGWEVKAICVEMVTTVVGLYSHTKTFYSAPILVFQILPTVSYRKNRIGINTANPDSNAMVDIHQSDGKETVLIQGFTTNFEPAKFEIDISTGKINFYLYDETQDADVLQHSLDLLNGILT